MGAGRRTQTYDVDTRNDTNYRFEQQQKNLGAQLGGVIFMCNTSTMRVCLDNMMFGLPSPHWCYVQHIRAGMPLFLYNFQTKELHGIFKAACDGAWEIDEYGWTDGTRRTPYPCQVQVEVYLACPPLPAATFRPLIAENLIGGSDKFQQELSKKQAAELCARFRSRLEGGARTAGAASSLGQAAAPLAAQRTFVPAAQPAARAWGSTGASSPAPMEAEPSGPPDMGGASFPELQAEEERRARKAAPPQAAAPHAPQQQQQQQPARPAAAGGVQPPRPTSVTAQTVADAVAAARAVSLQDVAPPAAANPGPQQAQQAQPAAGAGTASRPGVELLSDELSALKLTLNPVIQGMQAQRVEASPHTAAALQGHLSRLDDALMKAQKERGQAMAAAQHLAAQLAQLRGGAAGPSAAPAAAAAPAAPAGSAAGGSAAGAKPEELYLLGGNDQAHGSSEEGGWLSTVLVYSPRTNSWRQGPEMPLMRGYCCSGVLGSHLYVVGGGNSSEWLADVRRLDLRTGRWELAPPLSQLRGCAGAAALDGRLYVAGGGVADAQFDTVEIFNPEFNAWMPGPKLRTKRFSTAAGVLGGAVYATGGYNGAYLQSAERLDPREGKWQEIAPMAFKRGAHACTAGPGGLLYAIGGYDVTSTGQFMASVEAYEPRMNAWLPRAPMARGRAYGAAAWAEGALWAYGGMQSDLYNEGVERYDAATNRWSTIAPPANVPVRRAFLTCSVAAAL